MAWRRCSRGRIAASPTWRTWAAKARPGSAWRRSRGHKHLFQNIGDGTYFHSGRQGVLAPPSPSGVNITYKILYNGVVAMTGGQDVAGGSRDPGADARARGWRHRRRSSCSATTSPNTVAADELGANRSSCAREKTSKKSCAELEQVPGATRLIYDQMCAAEKRRRRNRGLLPQPTQPRRSSMSASARAAATALRNRTAFRSSRSRPSSGPKTRIHQSSCNVDSSLRAGRLPSFVTSRSKKARG